MEKTISSLVNKELKLEAKVKAQLIEAFKTIDIDMVLSNPQAELIDFTEFVIDRIFLKHITETVLIGVEFADEVNKKKAPIEIVEAEDVKNG